MKYDREVLVAVLIAHQRRDVGGCRCGWDILGHSHSQHVIDSYEQVMDGNAPCAVKADCVLPTMHGGPCVQVFRA
jgi:hypothetical protein